MRVAVVMPKLGYDMSVGRIVSWRKQPGDVVRRGETLLEVEGDKVAVEIESAHTGTIDAIVHEAGSEVEVGRDIAYIETGDSAEGQGS